MVLHESLEDEVMSCTSISGKQQILLGRCLIEETRKAARGISREPRLSKMLGWTAHN